MQQNKNRQSERGNVFVFILLGIVLFAALSFSVARGFRSDTTNNLTRQQAGLAASDILNYSQQVARAVDRLRRKGISENDISFENAIDPGYVNPGCSDDRCRVFSSTSLAYKTPPANSNDGSPWLFSGIAAIRDQDTTDEFATNAPDLVVFLPGLNEAVCRAINQKLGHGDIILAGLNSLTTTKFTGTYILRDAPSAKQSGCMNENDTNSLMFLNILIER